MSVSLTVQVRRHQHSRSGNPPPSRYQLLKSPGTGRLRPDSEDINSWPRDALSTRRGRKGLTVGVVMALAAETPLYERRCSARRVFFRLRCFFLPRPPARPLLSSAAIVRIASSEAARAVCVWCLSARNSFCSSPSFAACLIEESRSEFSVDHAGSTGPDTLSGPAAVRTPIGAHSSRLRWHRAQTDRRTAPWPPNTVTTLFLLRLLSGLLA